MEKQETEFIARVPDGAQELLFPHEDLILPDSIPSFSKSISAIHATPIAAPKTLNRQRLIDACIILAQMGMKNRGLKEVERIRASWATDLPISPIFEVRITQLADVASIPGKNYVRIREELQDLYEMSWSWNVIGGETSEVQWAEQARFFSQLEIGKGPNKGLIRFAFSPALQALLLEPKYWATFSLKALQGFKTSPSYALYENAWRYINTDRRVTAALPTATWIDLLCGESNYVRDDGQGGREVVNYADFKRRILADAIERVNHNPALTNTLKLIEHTRGRKVVKIQFEFEDKIPQYEIDLSTAWPKDIVDALKSIGFSESEIRFSMERNSLAQIEDALKRLKAAQVKMKGRGQVMTSIKAYFRGILEKIIEGADSKGPINDEEILAAVQRQEAERLAAEREEKIKVDFNRHLDGRIKEWISYLNDDVREALFDDFLASDAGKGLAGRRAKWAEEAPRFRLALRTWLKSDRPELLEAALPNPEDKSIEEWMKWRIFHTAAIEGN